MGTNTIFRVALVSLALVGCKAKVGDSCTTVGVCDGTDQALLCVGGKYVATACKGPARCSESPFRCDFSGNAGGEDCTSAPELSSRCAPDGKARLQCTNGKVSREDCEGPRGCYQRPNSTAASCDAAVKVGGRCSEAGDWCSTDGNDWLSCTDGKLVLAGKCTGPGKCKTMGGGVVACDVGK